MKTVLSLLLALSVPLLAQSNTVNGKGDGITDPVAFKQKLHADIVYDVRDYKVGNAGIPDDANDDTAAFAAAVAAMPAGGGVLQLPAGLWRVSGLTINKPVLMRGPGMGSVPIYNDGGIVANTTLGAASIVSSSLTANCITVTSPGCSFQDLTVYNTNRVVRPSAGHGIKCEWNDSSHFTNVLVDGFFTNVSMERGHVWTMTNCAILNPVSVGLISSNTENPDAGDASIVGCVFSVFESNGGAECALRIAGSGGVKVSNCKFNGFTGLNKFNYLIDMQLPDGVATSILKLSNNSFENWLLTAVRCKRASGGTTGSWEYVQIHDNQFGAYGGSGGIELGSGISYSTIEGNNFSYCNGGSIAISSGAAQIDIGRNFHRQCNGAVLIADGTSGVTVAQQVVHGADSTNFNIITDSSVTIRPAVNWADSFSKTYTQTGFRNLWIANTKASCAGVMTVQVSGLIGGEPVNLRAVRSYTRDATSGETILTTVGTDIAEGATNTVLGVASYGGSIIPYIDKTTSGTLDFTASVKFEGDLGQLLRNSYTAYPQVETWLTAVGVAGSSVNANNRVVASEFVRYLDGYGYLSKLQFAYLLAGPTTRAGAMVPLVGSAPVSTGFVDGDYSRTLGLAGAEGKYLSTGMAASAFAQNDMHFAAWSTAADSGGGLAALAGIISNRAQLELGEGFPGQGHLFLVSHTGSYVTDDSGVASNKTGFLAMSRGTSTHVRSYYAGREVSIASTSTTPGAPVVYVFSRANVGDEAYDGRLAFASGGTNLPNMALVESLVKSYVQNLK